MPIIAQVLNKSNQILSRIPEGTLTIAVVLLACSGSFGLGVLSTREGKPGDIRIVERPLEAGLPMAAAAAAGAGETLLASTPPQEAPITPITAGGQYVASKNGERYYLPWCGGVKNIKEENKIWFNSKAEAEARGFTPAANCKGI